MVCPKLTAPALNAKRFWTAPSRSRLGSTVPWAVLEEKCDGLGGTARGDHATTRRWAFDATRRPMPPSFRSSLVVHFLGEPAVAIDREFGMIAVGRLRLD